LQAGAGPTRLSIDEDGPLQRRISCRSQARDGVITPCDHKSLGLVLAAWHQIAAQQVRYTVVVDCFIPPG
jgi:hypothetical protein